MFSFSVMKSTFCLAYIEIIAIPATSFVDNAIVNHRITILSSVVAVNAKCQECFKNLEFDIAVT